jgi:eukaryotic-like serine/threonine-protein kinase
MPLATGDRLGVYEVIASIGKGGMGDVWKARDTQLGRDVAIKVSAQQFTDRFEREARAIASLNHQNVCTLYHIGPNYLVMEYIEGPTLAERIAEGPIPLEEALRIARQIAAALEAADEKNIVHRDLKPANVKIRPDGSVKVLDFGLAKSAEPAELSADSPTMMSMSAMGMIMGTAGYMSPEQARGRKDVDKRADIWAFGVVLYEMLTGKRLFQGEDIGDTLASVIKEQPSLDEVPPQVLPLLKRCLEKDPRKRLRDIGDMDLLLGLEATRHPPPAPAAPVHAASAAFRLAWIAAGVFALVAAAVSFVHFRETPPAAQTLRYTVAAPEGSTVHSFAISPDGRYLVIAAAGVSGKRQLWLRAMDALQAQPMPFTEDATYPFWSPDSRYIGFFAQGKLKKVAASGGPSQSLCDVPQARGGTWGRDDVIIFSPGGGGGRRSRRPDEDQRRLQTSGISSRRPALPVSGTRRDGRKERRVCRFARWKRKSATFGGRIGAGVRSARPV